MALSASITMSVFPAEDVAQDALVLAYRHLGEYRGEAGVRTWMVAIAWRLSLSRRVGRASSAASAARYTAP